MGTLANGIKDIFSTSRTTATHLPVCASDGTPQGRISVSDLASVLGGMIIRTQQLESFDIDVAQQLLCGLYQTKEPSTGFPTTSYGTLIVFLGNNGFKTFMWIDQRSGKLYYRSNWTTSFKSNWLEISTDIPTFYKNYADLSSLVSAIGALNNKFAVNELPNGTTSLNGFKDSGFYIFHTSAVSGLPAIFESASVQLNLIVISEIQIIFHNIFFQSKDVYIRCSRDGYNSWRKIVTVPE